jgi:hypothetical protein
MEVFKMDGEKVPASIPGMQQARDSFFEVCLALHRLYKRLDETKLVDPVPPEVHYDRQIVKDAEKGLAHIATVCDDLARFVGPLNG